MEYITVNLFRVSQESVYLDIITECLCGYIFNKIEVGVRTYDHYGLALTENYYSLTDAILAEYPNNLTSKISARIPLSEFFGEGEIPPAIYSLTLGCVNGDGLISYINLTKDEFTLSVAGARSKEKVKVVADNLRLVNSEELSKIENDGKRTVNGTIYYRTEDGELLSINDGGYQLWASGNIGTLNFSYLSGSTGVDEGYLSQSESGLALLRIDGRDYLEFNGNTVVYDNYYCSSKEIFNISGSTGLVGLITPQPLPTPTNNCALSLDTQYGTDDLILIPDSSAGGFKAGDTIDYSIKLLYTAGSGQVGLVLRKSDGSSTSIVYKNTSMLSTDYYSGEYILQESDIHLDGSIHIVRSGYSSTGFNFFSIDRPWVPPYPKIIISGDLTIQKVGLPNTDTHETTVYTSDTNSAFYYLMDNILNLDNSCTPISDDAIRNYLILYGHMLALENGLQSIAEEYFKILVKNFTKCGNNNRACGGPCGCNSSPCGPPAPHHPIHNSCNCKA